MSARSPALITPALAKWARERAGASQRKIADRLRTRPELVASWESGESRPSMQQAEKLARTLNVPLGYLFLPAPPDEKLALPDFRTVKDATLRRPSPNLTDVLNDAVLKQQWYRDFLVEQRSAGLSFVGSRTKFDDFDLLAQEIRAALSLTDKLRKACSSVDELIRRLSSNAESLGILVLRSGVVGNNTRRTLSAEEFRGFAISDEYAPLIFINAADYTGAQIFTFAHELVHIWIGASGVSNPDIRNDEDEQSETERFCNIVAAEILVPAAELSQRWNSRLNPRTNVDLLARTFKVSSLVVLRRALELKKISREAFFHIYAEQQKDFEEARTHKKSSESGDFYATLGVHNSKLLTRTIVATALEGRMLYRDAARLLNVQVPTIFEIAEHLRQKR